MDRGSFSVEVILTLLAFSVLYPDCVHLARGNHESKNMNAMYGFDGEVRAVSAPATAKSWIYIPRVAFWASVLQCQGANASVNSQDLRQTQHAMRGNS